MYLFALIDALITLEVPCTRVWIFQVLAPPIHLLPASIGHTYVPVDRNSAVYHQDSYVGRCQPLLPISGGNCQYTAKKGWAAHIYCAPGMVIRHVNSPGGCPIATVQDITDVGHWRKDKSTIKDDIE